MKIYSGKDLSDEYLKLIGKRKLFPPLNNYSAFIQGSEYNRKKYYGKWYADQVSYDLFVYMKEGYSQVWLPEDDVVKISIFGLEEHLRTPDIFEKRLNHMDGSILRIDDLYSKYTHNHIQDCLWLELFETINETRDFMWSTNAAVFFSVYLDKKIVLDTISKYLPNITSEDLDRLWLKGTEPAFESFDKNQTIDFLSLLEKNPSWGNIVEHCQYFLADYFSVKPLSVVSAELEKRYKKYIDDRTQIALALKSEKKELHEKVIGYNQWLNTLHTDERLIARYLQLVMKTRDRRKNFFNKGTTIIYRIAERMFGEVGVDSSLIPYYTVRELLLGPEYLSSVKATLAERRKGFQWLVPYNDEPSGSLVEIETSSKKINNYFKSGHLESLSKNLIVGQPGSKGKVTGKVHVVTNVNSEHGFQEGEILVTGMTRPEYVPLMKKAKAIITDEGGITCHAAIVSRELGIPCVIGTKIATQVLKDGDMVEVDAEKGIVRVIK